MRVPKRQAEQRRKYGGSDDHHFTPAAIRKLQEELERLQRTARPRTVEELSRAREMGDLSENAAYSMAKGRLAGIDARIFSLKEKLKHAIVIEPGTDPEGRVRIGSTVIVEVGGRRKTYEITGAQETDPAAGRISHASPLGAALLGHKAGEDVSVAAGGKQTVYRILEVR